MATTRIMPLHTGKGRTESQAVSDIIDYVSNPQKTDNGRLVTGYPAVTRKAGDEPAVICLLRVGYIVDNVTDQIGRASCRERV